MVKSGIPTGEVLGQDFCALIPDGIRIKNERLQGLVLLQRLHKGCGASHSDAILAQICCLTPAGIQQAPVSTVPSSSTAQHSLDP